MATLHNTAVERDGAWLLAPISWRAILAGLAVAIALQLVLSLLGAGIGFSFVEPVEGATPSAQAFGIGASLWWLVSWVLSLSAGAIVAVLSSDEITRCRGALLGIVIWALATIAGACLFTNVAGGALKATASAVGVAGSGAAAGGALLAKHGGPDLGLDGVRAEAEDFLRNAKASVDKEVGDQHPGHGSRGAYWHALTRYLNNTDEASKAVDRDRVVSVLADASGVSKEEADAEVAKLETAYAQGKEKAKQAADAAAEATAKFSLWATLGFLLSLVAAVVAGSATARGVSNSVHKQTY